MSFWVIYFQVSLTGHASLSVYQPLFRYQVNIRGKWQFCNGIYRSENGILLLILCRYWNIEINPVSRVVWDTTPDNEHGPQSVFCVQDFIELTINHK